MNIKPTLLFLLLALNSWASDKYDPTATYAPFVDIQHLILQFDPNLTEAECQTALREETKLAPNISFLPAPTIAIAKTKSLDIADHFALIERLEQNPHIHYVGLYMHNGEGHHFGILNKIFVRLKNSDDQAKLEAAIQGRGISSLENYTYNETIRQFTIDKTAATHPLAIAMELHNSGNYQFAEPNYLLNPEVHTTDPLFYKQWAIQNEGTEAQWEGTPGADMSVIEAWDLTMGDPNIRIAVMDSGIDTLHPDLYGQLAPGFDATGQGSNGYPDPRFPSDGHGTACAGIISAKANNPHGISGVAPDCKVLSSRIFFYADTTFLGFQIGVIPFSTSEILADGTNWAWQVANADIQSHSWSLPNLFLSAGFPEGNPALVDDALLNASIMGRAGKGSLLLFSSGNEGDPPNWPSRSEYTMAVNATSMCDEAKTPTSCDSLDWSGNFGANLDFGAPGVRITTLDMLDTAGFSNGDYVLRFSGTSAACPNVAGVAALMLSANPDLEMTEYREILSRTCDKVGGYAYDTWNTFGSWSQELGYGRINAHRAVLGTINFTATEELLGNKTFQIWPNPTASIVHFEGEGLEELMIYDATGKLLHSHENVSSGFSIEHLPSGIYHLKSRVGAEWATQKLVVLR